MIRFALWKKVPPSTILDTLQGLLDVHLNPGDYYLCAPPGIIYPSKQQLPQATNTPVPETDTPPLSQPAPFTAQDSSLQQHSPAKLADPQPPPEKFKGKRPDNATLAYKPLGPVGHHQLDPRLLQSLLPEFNSLVEVNNNCEPYTVPPVYAFDSTLHQLLLSLSPENIQLLDPQCYDKLWPLYHAAAFIIPKISSGKLSLILHLRNWNKSQTYKPPKFKLPSVYTIRQELFTAARTFKKMFFSTWDVKNFYWSLKGVTMRFATLDAQGDLLVWQLQCVPFGWYKACFLGQQTHQRVVAPVPRPINITKSIYIDDGMNMGPSQQETTAYTNQILEALESNDFIISEKSKPEAKTQQTFIGKDYTQGQIANTDARCANIWALCMVAAAAPFLSHTMLTRILGVLTYGCCHTSNYAANSYIRMILSYTTQYTGQNIQLTQSLAACVANCMVPWRMQGFYPLYEPEEKSTRVYCDAGPEHIGMVYRNKGKLYIESRGLPKYLAGLPAEQRQQSAELLGLLWSVELIIDKSIPEPTLVTDSQSAFSTVLKGSTQLNPIRTKILQKIQRLVIQHNLIIFIALINTKVHPADIPSRPKSFPDNSSRTRVKAMLKHIYFHPALIHYEAVPFKQDTSRDAWYTPYWVRNFLLKSPAPPTLDLFADATNALTRRFCSLDKPFSKDKLDGLDIYFYQPPYSTMAATWQDCYSVMTTASKQGFWGLVPLSFFNNCVRPLLSSHCCSRQLDINYRHPSLPVTPGANFPSLLFFISNSLCVCNHLEQHYISADHTQHVAASSRTTDLP